MRRQVARLLRRSTVLQRLVGRAAPPGRPPAFPAGTTDPAGALLPVVVFVALGVPTDALTAAAATIGRLQHRDGVAFRAFFVCDGAPFPALRGTSYPCEVLVSAGDWERLDLGEPWDVYVAARISAVRSTYRACGVLPVPVPAWSADSEPAVAAVLRSMLGGFRAGA